MGKVGKKNNNGKNDEKQTKISFFFENQTAMKKESKLFTNICPASNKSRGRLTLGKSSAPKAVDKSTSTRSKAETKLPCNGNVNKNRDEHNEGKDEDAVFIYVEDDVEVNGMPRAKEFSDKSREKGSRDIESHNCRSLQHDKISIADLPQESKRSSQCESSPKKPVYNAKENLRAKNEDDSLSISTFVTPEKVGNKNPNCTLESSPDIICDTPEVDNVLKNISIRQKRAAVRSFLCSEKLLTVQPGLKPSHLRVKPGIRCRKLPGKISINFNSQSSTSNVSPLSTEALKYQNCDNYESSVHAVNINTETYKNVIVNDDPYQNQLYAGDRNHSNSVVNQNHFSGCKRESIEMPAGETTLLIPETQFFDNIADEIVGEMEMAEVLKNSDTHHGIILCEPVKEPLKHIEKVNEGVNERYVPASSPQKGNLAPRTETRTNDYDTESSASCLGLTSIHSKSDKNAESLKPLLFQRTKSKSKLISALEEADTKADENEENMWMGERLMRHFAEDNNVLDLMAKARNSKENANTTPVKLYDGFKIKRLSKPGVSPSSKRQPHNSHTTELQAVRHDTNENFSSEMLDSVGSVRKALYLDSVSTNSNIPEVQHSKIKLTEQRAYQFGLKKKDKSLTSNQQITLEGDRFLTELLGQLNSSSGLSASKQYANMGEKTHPNCDPENADVLSEKNCVWPKDSKENNTFKKCLQREKDAEMLDRLFGNEDIITKEITEMGNTIEGDGKPYADNGNSGSIDTGKHVSSTSVNNFDDTVITEDVIQILDTEKQVSPISVHKMDDTVIAEDDIQILDLENTQGHTEYIVIDDNTDNCSEEKSSLNLQLVLVNNLDTCEAPTLPTEKTVVEQTKHRDGSTSNLQSVLSETPAPTAKITVEQVMHEDSCTLNLKSVLTENPDTCETAETMFRQIMHEDSSNENTIGVEDDFVIQNGDFPTDVTELSTSMYNVFLESFTDITDSTNFKKPKVSTKHLKAAKGFRFTDLWNRFTVLDVIQDRRKDETHLQLQNHDKVFNCILKGFWADTIVNERDIVNVLGDFHENTCIIDNCDGLIIVNPDLLLSGTMVVSSMFCARKSVLNEKFKDLENGNVEMLCGSIIHSLFQTVLKNNIRDTGGIQLEAKGLLKSNKFLHEMYNHNVDEANALSVIDQYIPCLKSWLEEHTPTVGKYNKPRSKESNVIVTSIHDIEENIWSPRLGLKGKIDVTVKVRLKKPGQIDTEKIIPLELKTGKASFSAEHKGQVTLYSMMYSDRRQDPEEGILLYLKNGQMQTVPAKPENKSGLIQLRNKLAQYLTCPVKAAEGNATPSLGRLPEPINSQRGCSQCSHLLTCSIYQRSVEHSFFPEQHAMTTLVPEAIKHLDEFDLEYFIHWNLCLDLEEQESRKRQLSQIWCSSSTEREQKGDCLSNLIIFRSELGIPESQSFYEGKGCSLTFTRHSSFPGPLLPTSGFNCGDMVVMSSEDGRYIGLATGFIRTISNNFVEVVVDRDYLYDTSIYTNLKFRLDRYDNFSTSGYLYTNLAQLMEPATKMKHMRDLVIKKHPPKFELKLSKSCIQKVRHIFKPLNEPQRAAILKVLMAKDYVLIKGFPGTGKTSTIVALVKILQLLGQSVLLTSYTHSAVDGILLKLKEEGVNFLRLGRQGRIHPSILPYSAEVLTFSPEINSVKKLKEFYDSYDIVATSCLGISHPIFKQRRFDVCIVDEASQILQPACLGPLFYSGKFVLVGDPKQLPPIVQSREARTLGMDESLFARLDNCGATFKLDLQYRMNRYIMKLSNRLVYEGQLRCGSQEVADASIDFDLADVPEEPLWMRQVLSPDLERSVVFIDTQEIQAHETPDGKGFTNETEADLIVSILKATVRANVACDGIGVVSPYRSQVRLIRHKVQSCPEVTDAEVNTIDQYQGREKKVIIVSFVRSQAVKTGELLKDLRRLNVAFTRARSKLILIGNTKTLKVYDHLAEIITWLEKDNNVLLITS